MKELISNILTMEVLLAVTFVFGVIHLITLTKIFESNLSFIFNALIPHNENTNIGKFFRLLGVWFFYFSLCFQAWYWLFSNASIFN